MRRHYSTIASILIPINIFFDFKNKSLQKFPVFVPGMYLVSQTVPTELTILQPNPSKERSQTNKNQFQLLFNKIEYKCHIKWIGDSFADNAMILQMSFFTSFHCLTQYSYHLIWNKKNKRDQFREQNQVWLIFHFSYNDIKSTSVCYQFLHSGLYLQLCAQSCIYFVS